MRTFFPYSDPDGEWRGKVLMLVTFNSEDDAWGTIVFKAVMPNYGDDDGFELVFDVDYDDPVRKVASHDMDSAIDVHVTMLRDLPRLAKEMTGKMARSSVEARHSMDYIR